MTKDIKEHLDDFMEGVKKSSIHEVSIDILYLHPQCLHTTGFFLLISKMISFAGLILLISCPHSLHLNLNSDIFLILYF